MTTLSEALAPRSDQLNADDLIPGPRVLKITGARISSEDRQKRMVLSYEGDQGKPWKPCKTMGRAMVMVWGITDDDYEKQLIGKSIRVYRDPEVRFGDQGQVGGIRISHMSHIDKPAAVKLTVSQGKKSVFTFHPLVTDAGTKSDPNAAQKWVDDHLGFVRGAADLQSLDAVIAGGLKAMTKLSGTNPDLHQTVTEAYDARRQALTDADPFEGRTNDQHGDQHDGSVAGDLSDGGGE